MRSKLLPLAVILATGLTTVTAHAANTEDYNAARIQHEITAVKSTRSMVEQFTGMAGSYIELEGVVSGMLLGDKPGFLMEVGSHETVTIFAAEDDADILIGNTLRVLARIPNGAKTLQGIAVTRPGYAYASAPKEAVTSIADKGASEVATEQPAEEVISTSQNSEQSVTENATSSTQVSKAKATKKTSSKKRKASSVKSATLPAATTKTTATEIAMYAEKIRQFNRGVDKKLAMSIATHVLIKSRKHGVDPRLTLALLAQESGFNPRAVSPVGAKGLGQLMPGTAAQLGVRDAFNIEQNIDGSVRYLAMQLQKFNGNMQFALAAYNAGPGNVTRYGGVPPFKETRNYVRVISTRYNALVGGVL